MSLLDSVQRWWVLSAGVLVLSYVYLAAIHGQVWLGHVSIHEDGVRTLGDTIFFFEHALRELPVVIFSAALIGAGLLDSGARLRTTISDRTSRSSSIALGCLVLAILLVGIGARVGIEHGPDRVIDELLQRYRRDDLEGIGSHWQYHLLAFPFCYFLARGTGAAFSPKPNGHRRTAWIFGAWIAATLLYRPTTASFVDPQFLAHQLREMITVTWLLLPPTAAFLISPARGRTTGERVRSTLPWLVVCLLIVSATTLPLLGQDVLTLARKESGILELLASHNFEHVLDYTTAFVAAALVVWIVPGRRLWSSASS